MLAPEVGLGLRSRIRRFQVSFLRDKVVAVEMHDVVLYHVDNIEVVCVAVDGSSLKLAYL